MRPSNNFENKTLSNTYGRVQLECMKVQAHSSIEPPLEFNQEDAFDESKFVTSYRNIIQFQISSRRKNR